MLKKIKLGPKLISGFVFVALITIIVGIIGYRSINEIGTVLLPSVEYLQEIKAQINFVRAAERSLLLQGIDRNAQTVRLNERWVILEDTWKKYDALPKANEKVMLWKRFASEFETWKEAHREVVNESDQGKYDEAKALSYGKAKEENDSMTKSLNDLVEFNGKEAESSVKSAIIGIIVAPVVCFVFAVVVGILLTISITRPIGKMVDVANKIAMGNVEQNIDYKSGDEIGILANAFRQMIDYIKGIATAAVSISKGDVSVEVKPKSDQDTLSKSFVQVTDSLKELVAEVGTLSKAAVNGKLDIRGDAQKFQGGYREIVQGVNDTLDAVIEPLNMAAEYIDRISKGNIPPKITDNYKGDFNEIKNNLNQCIDAVNLLIADANILAKAAVEHKFDTRADASIHQGDFRKIIEGVNNTLDSIVNPLNAMIVDINTLSKAAVEGKLDIRADASKHQGNFRKIVEGVNDTLDTVIEPINEAGEVLAQGAEGDLTVRVKGDYKGQLAELKNNINKTFESLESTISQVSISSTQVSSASGQIATGSQSLAEAASEQASSLEEISSSLEELSSMSQQNADNSSQAKNLSQEASNSAKAGNIAMEEMTNSIGKIKTSSDETAKIIKTIDEIAFQTNLLALNAAVEAARAGEAGKGFAVVAEEVRNLAQRSASAAKNTSDLIQQATDNADEGVKISEEVVKTFAEINQRISKVNDLIAEISAASTEQSQGIGQISTAVADIDKLTQSNAANSEESASAAQELSAQVAELRNMISKFKLSGNGHAKIESLSNLTSSKADNHSMLARKEKKKSRFAMKSAEQIPLDDSELAEF